jgi:hypothetical protein
VTEFWQEGDKILFSMKTAERGTVVQIGYATLRQAPAPKL